MCVQSWTKCAEEILRDQVIRKHLPSAFSCMVPAYGVVSERMVSHGDPENSRTRALRVVGMHLVDTLLCQSTLPQNVWARRTIMSLYTRGL